MVKVRGIESMATLAISRKIGFPWGYGRIWFGKSHFGDDLVESGIYRRQPTKKGQIFIRENFYWPKNTLSPSLELHRLIFAEGILAWRDLSPEEKNVFRAMKHPRFMSGYNRFLSLWLKALLG